MRVWVFSKFVSVSTRYIGRWFVSIKVFAAYNPIILMQKNTAEKMFAPAISKKVFNEIFKMFVRCSPIEAIKVIALEITNSNAKKINGRQLSYELQRKMKSVALSRKK